MTEQEFDQIEAHLNGEIDFAALTDGKSAEQIDMLRTEVAAQREARLAISVAALRQDLADIHGQATEGNVGAAKISTAKVRPLGRWLAIAAAVLLAIGAGFWLLDRTSTGSLLADYEYQDPGLPVVMGITDDRDFAEAMTDFKRGNYATALPVFEALSAAKPANDTLRYYHGATAYYQQQYATAVPLLAEVADDPKSLFRERAEWLLAFTYLHYDGVEGGRGENALQRIADQKGHRFSEEASRLLRAMKE